MQLTSLCQHTFLFSHTITENYVQINKPSLDLNAFYFFFFAMFDRNINSFNIEYNLLFAIFDWSFQ
jgi:hypothetical protein